MIRIAKMGGKYLGIALDEDNEYALEGDSENIVELLNQDGAVLLFGSVDDMEEFCDATGIKVEML